MASRPTNLSSLPLSSLLSGLWADAAKLRNHALSGDGRVRSPAILERAIRIRLKLLRQGLDLERQIFSVRAQRAFYDALVYYMDKDERYTHGEFETLEAAVEAAKKIVDDGLLHSYETGMSAAALYGQYTMFGVDPWIAGAETKPFSAWDYAKARCEIICAANRA